MKQELEKKNKIMEKSRLIAKDVIDKADAKALKQLSSEQYETLGTRDVFRTKDVDENVLSSLLKKQQSTHIFSAAADFRGFELFKPIGDFTVRNFPFAICLTPLNVKIL